MRRGTVYALSAVVVALALGGYAATSAPAGPRSLTHFDPQRVANLELQMWQAYYDKENLRLFTLLVTLLREQYHYSWTTAAREGFHLARAAARFGNARSNYEAVLPDLESGYATAQQWLQAGFDPAAVAKSELAWWVARRTPGRNSPMQVGDLIADEYALLYAVPRDVVLESARLRAQAGALRDATADEPDWNAVARLLTASYVQLAKAVRNQASPSASNAPGPERTSPSN
jgi:hypothetical protein